MQLNKVNAHLDVCDDMYTKGRYYNQFKRSEFDIISRQLRHVFTKEPLTSDEEKILKKDFLSRSVHTDSTFVDLDYDGYEGGKSQKTIESSGERRHKETKNAKLDKLDVALKNGLNQ
ncbi:hypothetical protein HN51_044903 [Arachis hypogaea]